MQGDVILSRLLNHKRLTVSLKETSNWNYANCMYYLFTQFEMISPTLLLVHLKVKVKESTSAMNEALSPHTHI